MQIVSYGAGMNSTAMLVEMVRRGEECAAVVFADTGGERPETYEHLMNITREENLMKMETIFEGVVLCTDVSWDDKGDMDIVDSEADGSLAVRFDDDDEGTLIFSPANGVKFFRPEEGEEDPASLFLSAYPGWKLSLGGWSAVDGEDCVTVGVEKVEA